MPIEIEAKFLNINIPSMREKLGMQGFICTNSEYLMRRVVFDLPGENPGKWARVRDEAGVITVSFKHTVDSGRVDGTHEIQILANNFDLACDLLSAFGLIRKSYQETRREVWKGQDSEITLDTWPGLDPFIEIEAPDERIVRMIAASLELNWEDALFGGVATVYEKIQGIPPHITNQWPEITFENPLISKNCPQSIKKSWGNLSSRLSESS